MPKSPTALGRSSARALSQTIAFEELTITVAADAIVDVVTALRDDPELRFVSFIDICGVDWPEREKRFDVVYHLLSPYEPPHPHQGRDRRRHGRAVAERCLSRRHVV